VSIQDLCNTTATVYSRSRVSDAFGGWTVTSDVRYADLPCRIQARKGTGMEKEGIEADSLRVRVTHMLFCPPEYSAISEDDFVVDASSNRYDYVRWVRDPDQMSHHIEVWMEQLKGVR